jgi:hypothetical protein
MKGPEMRRPVIALSVAASVFALTAAGATGFSLEKGVNDSVLLPGGSNEASVEYDIISGCQDHFVADYELEDTRLVEVSVTGGENCFPTKIEDTLTATSVTLTNGENRAIFSSEDPDANDPAWDGGYIFVSGVGSQLADGIYGFVRKDLPGTLPQEFYINLDANYSESTETLAGAYTFGLTKPIFEYVIKTEVSEDGITWVQTDDFNDFGDWIPGSRNWVREPGKSGSVVLEEDDGGPDLKNYKKFRVTFTISFIDYSTP